MTETGPGTILFTGGGTAGHVLPNLPLMGWFQQQGWQVHYAGAGGGMEQALVAPTGVPFHPVATGKLRRYPSVENLKDALRVPLGVVQGWQLARRLRPRVVFSKGGFVSVPVVVGARLAGVPVVAHESDLSPGLANRLAMPFLAHLCVNFPQTLGRIRARCAVTVTGTPQRQALTAADAAAGRALGAFAEPDRPLLLVTGGSLGAVQLNQAVRAALPALTRRWNLLHLCGRGRLDPALVGQPGYAQFEYLDANYGDALAAADLVVSRAGANALYELLAARQPHLLVPLPGTASRGDQLENAAMAETAGWSRVLQDAALAGPDGAAALVAAVQALAAESAERRAAMAGFAVPDSLKLLRAAILAAALPAAAVPPRPG